MPNQAPTQNHIPPWRLLLFVEAVLVFLLFMLVSGYVFWRTLPLHQYCDHLNQCIDLFSLLDKLKLALSAGTMFIYGFLGPLVVLCIIPFCILWLYSWLRRT